MKKQLLLGLSAGLTALAGVFGAALSTAAFGDHAPAFQQEVVEGSWEVEADGRPGAEGWIRVSDRHSGHSGNSIPDDWAERLLDAADDRGIIRLEIRREAGLFHFTGRADAERGWGEFVFTPDAAWLAAMDELGYRHILRRRGGN